MSKTKTFSVGGIHPDKHKNTSYLPIEDAGIPETVYVPVKQHIGAPAKILVKKGDRVKVGTMIADADGIVSADVHSPVSGEVIKVEEVTGEVGYLEKMITIRTEGDEWEETIDRTPDLVKDITASPEEIVSIIRNAGIVGMGGAGYPTPIKVTLPAGKKIDCIILNGIECEPYLTADDRLMQEKAEQIIIGAGNEYLLILLSQLLGRETGIAMEDPTYKQAYRVLGGMGHPVFPVGMDDSGFRVQELERLPASAAYVMPSHQFPMGIVMPVKRRQELLAWAMKEPDRYLIEDDYDSEFRYRGKPIPALQGMDDSGRVIYMGTFSKAIAPAIRVGYLVLPPSLMERYEERGWFYSSTVSRVDQRILAMFIGGGYFERHLNRMREIYKGKHDLLLASLKPLEKEFEISGEYAGLHVLLTCRGERTEEQLEKAAETEGIRVYGLSGSYIGKKDTESRTVILGYASLTEEKIQEGAAALAKALCP